MEMAKSTYRLEVFCTNCDFKGMVDIPKGVAVLNHKCLKCDMPTLEKIHAKASFVPKQIDFR